MIRFVISGNNYKGNCLPSYNNYVDICRANKWGANAWKHKYQEIIAKQIANQCENFYIDSPFILNMIICESSKRRDKDNVESFAKKLILDTLQEVSYIENDKLYSGSKNIEFRYEKNHSYIECEIIY